MLILLDNITNNNIKKKIPIRINAFGLNKES